MGHKRRHGNGTRRASGATDGVDLGASARQVGLFESANGMPHGPAAVVVAVVVALLLIPARALWRVLTGRGHDRS